MSLFNFEERQERKAAERNRRLAEERKLAEEAKERELQSRENQRIARHRARIARENERLEEAEHRLAAEARKRQLREAQQKEREEKKRSNRFLREKKPGFYNPNLRIHSVFVVALSLLAVFVSICFLLQKQVGLIGGLIASGLLGGFSYTACLVPIFMLIHAALWRDDIRNRTLVAKAVAFLPFLILSAALAAIFSSTFDPNAYNASTAYADGMRFSGGGVIGGAVGYFLHRMVGPAGTVLLTLVVYLFFAALYCRLWVQALYTKARTAIKAAMVENARKKDALRELQRNEKAEIAALRREEKHRQRLARIAGKEEASQAKQARAKENQSKSVTLFPAIEEPTQTAPTPARRVLFSAQEPQERRTPSRTNWGTEEEPQERKSAVVRNRSLFSDFEETPTPSAADTEPKDFSDITSASRTSRSPIGGFAEEDDFSAIRRRATKEQAVDRPAPAPAPAEYTYRPSPAPAARVVDPMAGTDDDFGTEQLVMTKERVRPVRAVEDISATVEAEDLPIEEPKKQAGNSPLGKLFRRAQEKAAAEAAARAKVEDDNAVDQDMNYFRSITVAAGEQKEFADRPLLHPDINPLAQPAPATRTYTAVDETVAESEPKNEPIAPAAQESREGDNPFHPRNNPDFKSPEEKKAPTRYDGLQGAQVFTPSSSLRDDLAEERRLAAASAPAPTSTPISTPASAPISTAAPAPARGRIVQEKIDMNAKPASAKPPYRFPPVSLLTLPDIVDEGNISAEVQSNAEKLVTTLDSFKVHTRVTGYSRGPRITRYEVVPDAGIRVRAIANLVEDISMSLATSGVRIEAPIPGKSAVGVEVPNSSPTLVRLRGMLDTEKFRNFPEKTVVCIGGDVTGQPVYCDLAKMPHLLVAGATGMGKSVCINSIITSILYKASPDDVKLIMIDPKKVEFGIYAGIPHLLVPVVTDPKKAAGALSWAVNEMERRYGLMEQTGVRDMKSYNRYVEETGDGEHLARIIIIIDELADLMASAADAVETSIARIAAKARAAGIHLLIGTQRPSVDVITGTIKNNIPSRIAFHVSSQVDSRTILDFAGAEKLLAHGDMLYAPAGMSKPIRVQGSFVEDKEIDRVVSFLKSNNEVDSTAGEDIMADIEREAEKCVPQKKSGGDEGGANIPTDDDDGHLLWAALEIGFEYGKLATSLLQRKLSVGYGKAAKILDTLQEMGCVSAPEGSKPREILISREEFKEMRMRGVQEKCGENFS